MAQENMNCGAVECTFLWFIENYSYCPQKIGGRLISPEFTADGLEGTVWTLQLYPRGRTDEQRGYISLYLTRKEKDEGPDQFPLKFELSVLAADGSAFKCRQFEHTFIKQSGYGDGKFLVRDKVLSRRKSNYLPQDALSVLCKMWKGEVNLQSLSQILHARTRIGVEWITYLHEAENFSSLDLNQKKTVHIKSPSVKSLALTSSLYSSDCSCCPERLLLEITPLKSSHVLTHCKVSLLDGSGKTIEYGEIDNRLDETGKAIGSMPLSLTRQDILSRKHKYLPGDKLSLFCECGFTNGMNYEKIEKTELGKSFVLSNRNKWADNATGKLSTSCGMAILKCLFVALISCFFGGFVSYLWEDFIIPLSLFGQF